MKVIKIPLSETPGSSGKSNEALAPDIVSENLKKITLNESFLKQDFSFETINLSQKSTGDSFNIIYEHILQNDETPLIIGGSRIITFPSAKAFSEKFPDSGIILFDAHTQCLESTNLLANGSIARALSEKSIFPPEKIIIAGTRSFTKKELGYISEKKIKHFTAKEISHEGITEISDSIMSAARRFGSLYLSVDIDVLDPCFAPGTSCPEPAGLTPRELIAIIQRLMNLKNIMAAEIVGINPLKDTSGITARTGAKIASEMYRRQDISRDF